MIKKFLVKNNVTIGICIFIIGFILVVFHSNRLMIWYGGFVSVIGVGIGYKKSRLYKLFIK